ncbi:MAG: tetratricopeptide repeat protein [Alphaproteobacteria bacterium]|nr:tetratricopeptide repeat protein [Alphaproteobacteria bacterium]MCW5739427.1 tetratricopeptide repeat protein [Alphaproteobacteria bacterium]
MTSDRFGYPLTTASEEAARHYGRAVDCMLTASFGAADSLDAALHADPDFALARIAKARWLQLYMRMPEAQAEAAAARALSERLTPREARHVDIIASAVEGAGAKALALLDAHLAEYPRDALPLSLALGVFGLLGFSGRRDHRAAELAILDRIAPHWGEDWYFLTFHGWARIESGDVVAGIAEVERSLSLNPRNAWGAHALAHGYHEVGNAEAGATFLAGWLPQYDRRSQLHGHLSWHQALFELDRENPARAHEVYADAVRLAAVHAPPVIKLADPAAYLWRRQIYGEAGPMDEDWREVAEYARQAFPRAGMHFADLHAVLADAATGDTAAAKQRIAEIRERLASGRLPHGEVVPALGEGIVAFAGGDYAAAADLIGPMIAEVVRVGGSHAQRELFEDTYLVACMRAGRNAAAKELLAQRLAHRPSARDRRWLASVG